MTGYYSGRLRDQWEATVAEAYTDELGLAEVGPRTSLRMAPGGTPGAAGRIAGRLRQATGLELTAAVVSRQDTVHALGSYLRRHARRDLCVQLLPDARGALPKLFYVHSASGNAFAIWALRKRLPVPLAGIRAAGLYGEREIPRTIGEFADIYLEEIRQAQPAGPYLLCGFSAGGTIALEIATRLRADGAEVALLAMIDTLPPAIGRVNVPDEEFLAEDRLRELLRRVEGRVRDRAAPDDAGVVEVLRKGEALAKDMGADALRRQLTIYARLVRAAAAHRPSRYPGTVHYFAAEVTSGQVEQWVPYLGDLRRHSLDAEHYEYAIFGDPGFQRVLVGLIGDVLQGDA